jgi:hypothetical protein
MSVCGANSGRQNDIVIAAKRADFTALNEQQITSLGQDRNIHIDH